MNINHAILHILDFNAADACSFAQRPLDLGDRQTKSFVQRHLRKAGNSPENKHGTFEPGSPFAGELEHYLAGRGDFVDLSTQIAQYLYQELRKAEGVDPCDILVADYEDDTEKTVTAVNLDWDNDTAQEATDAFNAAYEGIGERKFAVMILPRKQAFVHDARLEDGLAVNAVVRHDATLPSPTQKVDSYAIVNTRDLAVDFHDKTRTIAGAETLLIPDGLLRCSKEASCKDVIESMTRIVEEVAHEHGANTAVAVSKVKKAMAEKVAEDEYLPPWNLGSEVFEDEPVMRERFEEVARERALPERVNVKRSVATRMAKSHRIRTDTGIEITFPSEYSSNSDFIEFVTEADGSISIELKRIGSIENR